MGVQVFSWSSTTSKYNTYSKGPFLTMIPAAFHYRTTEDSRNMDTLESGRIEDGKSKEEQTAEHQAGQQTRKRKSQEYAYVKRKAPKAKAKAVGNKNDAPVGGRQMQNNQDQEENEEFVRSSSVEDAAEINDLLSGQPMDVFTVDPQSQEYHVTRNTAQDGLVMESISGMDEAGVTFSVPVYSMMIPASSTDAVVVSDSLPPVRNDSELGRAALLNPTNFDTNAPENMPIDPNLTTITKTIDETNADQTEVEQTDGEQRPPIKKTPHANTDQTNADQTHAKQTNVEQTNVEQTNVEQTDFEQTDFEQTDVEQTNVEQTDGKESHPIKKTNHANMEQVTANETNAEQANAEESHPIKETPPVNPEQTTANETNDEDTNSEEANPIKKTTIVQTEQPNPKKNNENNDANVNDSVDCDVFEDDVDLDMAFEDALNM